MHRRVVLCLCLIGLLALSACEAFRLTPVEPTPAPVHDSPFGQMGRYRTQSGRFEVDFPAAWNEAEGDDRRCQDAPKCLISRDSEFMLVREQTMTRGPDSLAAELDAVVAGFEDTTADAVFLSREPFTTSAGLPGEILRYSIEQGRVSVKELWAADGDQAVSVAFITWNEGFAAMEPLADYVFDTLTRTDAAAVVVVADVADKGGGPAEGRVAAGAVAAGLAHHVAVIAEVGLDAEVHVRAVEIDVGVDAGVADDHDLAHGQTSGRRAS